MKSKMEITDNVRVGFLSHVLQEFTTINYERESQYNRDRTECRDVYCYMYELSLNNRGQQRDMAVIVDNRNLKDILNSQYYTIGFSVEEGGKYNMWYLCILIFVLSMMLFSVHVQNKMCIQDTVIFP